jgi:tRNA modification GTPase
LSGAFSDQIRALVKQVVALRLLVEATLDFPEEEIEFLEKSNARGQLQTIRETLAKVFSQAAQGSVLREGLKVVLAGQPNVGKSSLLNALAGSDVAIVTSVAGTTRDKIIETILVDGIPINIIDTAGIRDDDEAPDEVERIGISRTWDALANADVIMHILDASRGPTRGDDEILARLPSNIPILRIWNKIDLSGHRAMSETLSDATHIYLSAAEHTGLELLRKELLSIAGWQQTGESAYLARERHLIALQTAQSHLDVAAKLAEQNDQSLDLFAEECRLAQDSLNSITGKFTSDDLLGAIFSRFCIGK